MNVNFKNTLLLFLTLALVSAPSVAQTQVASLTGIVTDLSRAVVPGADITIVNKDTGISYGTVSNDSGVYTAPSLNAGRYTVTVETPGFKKQEFQDVVLETGQKRRLDVTLDVGEITETIQVEAGSPLLMQETAEISEVLSSNEIKNIPLKDRNPYALLTLAAGVSARGSYADHLSVSGSRRRSNVYVVDGAPTTHIGGIGERVGSIEAIQEFKVLSSTYSAEFGRTSGGVIIFQVKSGNQNYHGSLYEFHLSNALDANSWENNARGVEQAVLIRNEFGGTLGGPIPALNKKMFFFVSYEGVRDSIPVNRTRTIPDPSLRGGDFSSVPVVINDPLTGKPFPNNVIPLDRLDPAAVRFLKLFPNPNTQGTFNSRFGIHTNNWVRPGGRSDNKNYLITRFDYHPTDKHKFFFTYSHINEGPRDLVIDFDNVLNTTIGPRLRNIRRWTLGYTRFFTTSWTNEVIVNVQRDPRKITPWFPDFDATKELGIQRKVGPNLPRFTIAGGYGSYGDSLFQDWVHQPGSVSNLTTVLKRRHNIKFGAQLFQNQFWYISSPHISGTYNFNGEITGLGTPGRNNPINALADLLLGAVKTAEIPIPQIPVNRFNYNLGLFINDDWKVTNRLTLNLGLRYEFETHQQVKNNIYSRLDLATGELLVAGRNASRNLNMKNDYLNLSPRFGIAYSLSDKTVIRSGFAIFHSNIWVNNGEMLAYPGFTGTRDFVDQGLGKAQPFTLSQGFPREGLRALTDPFEEFAAATAKKPLPHRSVTYNPTDKLPSNIQWNLGIQREIGFDTVLDVAYVGSKSTHLSRTFPINNPSLDRAADVVVKKVPIQQVRPYPRFTGLNAVFYDANAYYQSLQVKATRRFRSGFGLDTNYTFSKNIDTASGLEESFQIPWQFPDIERGLSSLDRTHIFTVGSVYELPFGKGRRWLADRGLLSTIIGGFQFNGLFNAATGLPLTIRQRNTNLILQDQRPNVVDPSNLSGKVETLVFQGAARRWLIAPDDPRFPFAPSDRLGFGNLGRNTTREPGFWDLNLSLFRQFRITEDVNLEFRLEAFNALNHVNFLNPASTDINSANYGLILGAAPARQVQVGLRLEF